MSYSILKIIGSDFIHESFDKVSYDEMKAALFEELGRQFRPEFLNRIDETVVFHPLGQKHIKSIATIQLHALQKRLKARDYEIAFNDQSIELLVDAGYDPIYGARPLKRAIQQLLENPLAQKLLSGSLLTGEKILVDVKEGKIHFQQ